MKKITRTLLPTLLLTMFAALNISISQVSAQSPTAPTPTPTPAPTATTDNKSAVCEGAGLVNGASGCTSSTANPSPDVNTVVKTGVNLFSAIVGVIAVVMVILAGLHFITAQGDPGKVATARNTLIYAAIGIMVVALAQLFVKFVLKRFGTP